MKTIKTFTNNDLEKAAEAVKNDEVYGREADLIRDCFTQYPDNINREIVAMKCGLIDITNSTNLSLYKSNLSVVKIVEILLSIPNLDERIKKGDLSLITEISSRTKNENNVNLFSFATKYCCYHNIYVYGGDAFSIYDKVMRENLPNYITGVSKYKLNQLRENHDYLEYMRIIDEILENNNITVEFKRRKLDNLLWYYNR